MKVAHQILVCFISSIFIGLLPFSNFASAYSIPVKSKKESICSVQEVSSKLNNQCLSESEEKQLNEVNPIEGNEFFFIQPSMNHLYFSLGYYDLIQRVRKIHFYRLHSFIYSGLSPPSVS
jgi:hypothetical protein